MDDRFHRKLDKLRMTVLQMAALTQRALERALSAMFERDSRLAQDVIEGDRQINMIEVDIDKFCLELLALGQPMAKDLRTIIGSMRIAVDLERVADQAVNVAERALFLNTRTPLPSLPALKHLAETAVDMLRTVITAYADENTELALEVCQMDDTADELNVYVLKNLLDYMINEVPAVERSVQTIIAARCLERAADQATNIAESVIFMKRGVNIKHGCKE